MPSGNSLPKRPVRYMLIRLCSLAMMAYLALMVLLYTEQQDLMYHPEHNLGLPEAYGLPEVKEVALQTSDKFTIIGWYAPPPEKDGLIILYLHGNAGHLGSWHKRYREMLKAGYGVFAIDYRGYGRSQGEPSQQGLLTDAVAAWGYLMAEGYAPEQVIIYGMSLGSAVATHLAQNKQIHTLVLEGAFASIADVAQEMYPYAPVRLLLKDHYPSAEWMANVNAPVLMSHGEADQTVPIHHGQKLFAAAPEPKTFLRVPGVDHNDIEIRDVLKALAGF